MGVSGLLVAGILGAAMGSLSSALNSMSNSTVADIIDSFVARRPVRRRDAPARPGDDAGLGGADGGLRLGFIATTGNVYLTGLAIAGYTYGALLGAFLLGRLVPRATEPDAILAFVATLIVMTSSCSS